MEEQRSGEPCGPEHNPSSSYRQERLSELTMRRNSDDGTLIIRRTTTEPVRSIKGQRPRAAAPISLTMCRTSVTGVLCHVVLSVSCGGRGLTRCQLTLYTANHRTALPSSLLAASKVAFVGLAGDRLPALARQFAREPTRLREGGGQPSEDRAAAH
jgi:hypothetical protein